MARRGTGVFSLTGDQELLATLSALGKIAQHDGPDALRRLADEIADGARERVPEKTGALADSIRVVENPRSVRTYEVAVQAGPVMNAQGAADYAVIMHEGLGLSDGESFLPYGKETRSAGGDGRYTLGPLSAAKNAGRTPHEGTGVGWKFLERAFESVYRKALRRINDRIKRAVAEAALKGRKRK